MSGSSTVEVTVTVRGFNDAPDVTVTVRDFIRLGRSVYEVTAKACAEAGALAGQAAHHRVGDPIVRDRTRSST